MPPAPDYAVGDPLVPFPTKDGMLTDWFADPISTGVYGNKWPFMLQFAVLCMLIFSAGHFYANLSADCRYGGVCVRQIDQYSSGFCL